MIIKDKESKRTVEGEWGVGRTSGRARRTIPISLTYTWQVSCQKRCAGSLSKMRRVGSVLGYISWQTVWNPLVPCKASSQQWKIIWCGCMPYAVTALQSLTLNWWREYCLVPRTCCILVPPISLWKRGKVILSVKPFLVLWLLIGLWLLEVNFYFVTF